ncbi:MAG: chemotaxis protein CheW [Exilispira sp.]
MNEENLQELLVYYFEESNQILSQLESLILILEKDYTNKEVINEIFRNVHTLKGSSASMGFKEIADFSHILENSFDYLRNLSEISLNAEIIDIILESLDILKNMVTFRNEGKIFQTNLNEIESKIESIRNILPSAGKENIKQFNKENKQKSEDKENVDIEITKAELEIFKNQLKPGYYLYEVIVEFAEDDPMSSVGPLQVYSSLRDLSIILKTFPTLDEMNKDKFFNYSIYLIISKEKEDIIKKFIEITDIVKNISVKQINLKDLESKIKPEELKTDSLEEEKIEEQNKDVIKEGKIASDDYLTKDQFKDISKASTILRVDSKRIDELLNLVSQIVINKAALIEHTGKIISNISSFDILSSDIAGLISYLNTISETDMNSITLSKNQILKILNMLGQSSTIIDSIKASTNNLSNELQVYSRTINLLQEGVMKIRMVPIEQMLSRFPRIIRDLSKKLKKDVDLIIEGEDTELDKTIIEELSDPVMHILRNCMDHGIEEAEKREKLGKKTKGTIKISAKNEGNIIKLIIEDDGAGIDIEKIRKKAVEKKLIGESRILSSQEAIDILFSPGFSTAEKVSEVSGRGVGLDVVKKSVENLNGSVSVESEINKFTRFTIKIPLTLAIIQALLVYVSNQIYAIPISNIVETKRISENEIIKIEGKDAIKIRDEYVSVILLNEIFDLSKERIKNHGYLIIVSIGDKKLGLVVDSLIGSQDIVIKPLKNLFTRVKAIAGCAILGDGSIALIIDINQLIESERRSEISEVDLNVKN